MYYNSCFFVFSQTQHNHSLPLSNFSKVPLQIQYLEYINHSYHKLHRLGKNYQLSCHMDQIDFVLTENIKMIIRIMKKQEALSISSLLSFIFIFHFLYLLSPLSQKQQTQFPKSEFSATNNTHFRKKSIHADLLIFRNNK